MKVLHAVPFIARFVGARAAMKGCYRGAVGCPFFFLLCARLLRRSGCYRVQADVYPEGQCSFANGTAMLFAGIDSLITREVLDIIQGSKLGDHVHMITRGEP